MTDTGLTAAGRLLAEKLAGDDFACVAGKSALHRGLVVHRHFDRLGAEDTTTALYRELVGFAQRKDDIDELLATFAATFDGPVGLTEQQFETALWQQLQLLHERDATRFAWSERTDPDPASPNFGYSIAGHPFFVVGLHATASRISRRFALPTLVFNSHVQFDRLRRRGIYQRLRREIQARELALQGTLNPNLAEFGETSEAVQYSGRAVEPGWRCPFHQQVPMSTQDSRAGGMGTP